MSKTPKLCKQGNLAYVRIHGRKVYLGAHGTAEAQREYHRVIAEYHANASAQPRDKRHFTIDELADEIGLRHDEFKKWLTFVSDPVTLINGNTKPAANLGLTDILAANQYFKMVGKFLCPIRRIAFSKLGTRLYRQMNSIT